MGKTYANRALIAEAIRRHLVDLVMILDDKGVAPQYEGAERANVGHLRRAPTAEAERVIVFRGHTMRTGEVCGADEVARAAFELAMLPAQPKVMVSIDELRRAASPAGREWRSAEVPRLFSEGGGIGVSVTWTTQSPQRIPLEAFDQTETIGIFRLRGRALGYLEEYLEPELVRILPDLRQGEFVLYRASEPWDGRVYRLGR